MKCSNCGVEIDPDATECPGCGLVFESEVGGPDVGSKIPSSWLGIGAGVLVAAVGTQIFASMFSIFIGAGVALLIWILGAIIR
ncbi:MAG: zinc-ribbon domain-containing protein [Halopenitus sp.]